MTSYPLGPLPGGLGGSEVLEEYPEGRPGGQFVHGQGKLLGLPPQHSSSPPPHLSTHSHHRHETALYCQVSALPKSQHPNGGEYPPAISAA